ncbi:MAG TPA: cyclopropane-fatty-acyl-phospholipid synthase, partial [Chromatiales bacterium]|nr:cyclopropane-fatty-acyl-phospholipid synthase [Chromatiales bacterium]
MRCTEKKFHLLKEVSPTGTASTSAGSSLSTIGIDIVSTILTGYQGPVAIRLWDGHLAHGAADASCTAVFKEPGALRDLILHRNLLRLADSYLSGAIDVEGDLESLFDLKTHLCYLHLSPGTRLHLLRQALRLPRLVRHGATRGWRAKWASRRNSRASIAHHYDVSNDFYRLWLDPDMVYSCAYFKSSEQTLADGQRDKLDYLCRKLRLEAGQTLLDIGCGWGGLMKHAISDFGAVSAFGL